MAPSPLACEKLTLPSLMVKPPVKVFKPESTSVPDPDLVSPAVPSMMAEMVAVFVAPRALTVMVGVVPAKIRLFVAAPLFAIVHEPAVDVLLSPKMMLPIVWSAVILIVVSAAISLVKFAVLPLPVATVPEAQFPVALQVAGVVVADHVPLCAEASEERPLRAIKLLVASNKAKAP